MATLRLTNFHGLNRATRKKIRAALRAASEDTRDRVAVFPRGEASPSKWHNVRTTVDGITFASKHEADTYSVHMLELRAGEITDLELQKVFRLDLNGIHICNYVADFVYTRNGLRIVEDAKGERTDVYKIKRLLMRAILGIAIVEV